ncbi:MAG TPA: YegS/Rv2252/BmrU family lipid kinase [Chloroflexota bacterium]|nr:YegS/Rv2252/BmrU family lipid kinase [Chloroflexota bacterium]
MKAAPCSIHGALGVGAAVADPGTQIETGTRPLRSAALIVNTHSRRGADFFPATVEQLARHGIRIAAAYSVFNPERLPDVTREAIALGHQLVIVGGGDGTIRSVVDCFAYTDVVLGILPLGTANTFARTLGIPATLDGAVDVIANGRVAAVDLGRIGDVYFTTDASAGFATEVSRQTPRVLKRYLGMLAYGLVGAKQFFRHRPFRCTLTIRGQAYALQTHQVIVANGACVGVKTLVPGATLNDGELVVLAIDTLSRWKLFKMALFFWIGRQTSLPNTQYWRTSDVTIATEPPRRVDVDGEVATETPVRVAVARAALKVMTPAAFVDQPSSPAKTL